MKHLDDRYKNDADFHALVKHLECMIINLKFGPSEIREAAMYANLRCEWLRMPEPITFSPALTEELKEIIYKQDHERYK